MVRRGIQIGLVCALVLLGFGASLTAYGWVRTSLAAEVYRERLETMQGAYADLRDDYNRAVARTAVTELLVSEDRLFVRVRTAGGVVDTIETPFDPSREVYIDYVVLDGRLWIRRVFDGATPPSQGIVIEPRMATVDWQAPGASFGQAVYRELDEGRWVVTVTGSGALGLARADGQTPDLAPAPEIHEFDEIAETARREADAIGVGEVWRRIVGID